MADSSAPRRIVQLLNLFMPYLSINDGNDSNGKYIYRYSITGIGQGGFNAAYDCHDNISVALLPDSAGKDGLARGLNPVLTVYMPYLELP